jgi:hypothetical protein
MGLFSSGKSCKIKVLQGRSEIQPGNGDLPGFPDFGSWRDVKSQLTIRGFHPIINWELI